MRPVCLTMLEEDDSVLVMGSDGGTPDRLSPVMCMSALPGEWQCCCLSAVVSSARVVVLLEHLSQLVHGVLVMW